MHKIFLKGLIFIQMIVFVIIICGSTLCQAREITDDKVIALTFDDGPHGKYTPMILDILKKHNAHATFFLLGERAEKLPEVVSRIYDEGHSIGNHTYDHTELTSLNDKGVLSQLSKTNKIIEDITGRRTVLMRPPLGGRNKRIDGLIKDQNMCTILWNVDPLDWYYKDAQRTHNHVIKKVKSGDIILLHDFYQNTVMATEKILETLEAQGYRFVTIDELLGLSGGYSSRGDIYYSQSLELLAE